MINFFFFIILYRCLFIHIYVVRTHWCVEFQKLILLSSENKYFSLFGVYSTMYNSCSCSFHGKKTPLFNRYNSCKKNARVKHYYNFFLRLIRRLWSNHLTKIQLFYNFILCIYMFKFNPKSHIDL